MNNEVACSNCGTRSPTTAAFCGNCGQPLAAPSPIPAETTQPQPGVAAARPEVPPEVVDFVKGVLTEAFRPGVLIGAAAAGTLLYLPSRSLVTAGTTALISLVVLGSLRAGDGYLLPLWRWLLRIPPIGRIAAATLLPILFSRTMFQPDAAGKEISRARLALIVSTVVAYVFMRPRKSDALPPPS